MPTVGWYGSVPCPLYSGSDLIEQALSATLTAIKAEDQSDHGKPSSGSKISSQKTYTHVTLLLTFYWPKQVTRLSLISMGLRNIILIQEEMMNMF